MANLEDFDKTAALQEYVEELDGSIHACNVLNPTGFSLPFCFGSLCLYGKTTEQSYGFMEKLPGGDGVSTYNGILYDEQGRVVARLNRYSMRSVEQSESAIFDKKRMGALRNRSPTARAGKCFTAVPSLSGGPSPAPPLLLS